MTECPDCRKLATLCVCAECAPLPSRLRVVVLQHPQEPDQLLGTAPLIARSLPNARVRVGLSWPNLRAAVEDERAEPRRWGVLYLGSGVTGPMPAASPAAPDAPPRARLIPVDKKGAALPPDAAAETLRELDGLILLDGTWSQAKAIWWRNAWLLKARRLILVPAVKSRYGELRREPRAECLSTLETLAYSLESLGEPEGTVQGLLTRFDSLLAKYRAAGLRPPRAPGGAAGGRRRNFRGRRPRSSR